MKKMMMAMIIGCCLAVLTDGSVFAEDSILAKQKEIDQYVFVQHKEDIAAKGMTVTSTAPQDGYVEVAITPYNDANAEYLYGIFGKDKVKVVEGQRAVLFGTAATAASAAAPSGEAPAPAAATKSASTITVASIVAAIVLLGAGGFAIRKRRTAKR
jgi:hypothetical protein